MPNAKGGLPPRRVNVYDRQTSAVADAVTQLPGDLHAPFRPAADPFQAQAMHQNSLGRSGYFKFGRVINAMPYINWYRVQLDEGEADFPCNTLSSGGSLSPIGVRDTSMIIPGAAVWVYKHPRKAVGTIMGVIPEPVEDANNVFPDWVAQGGGAGFQREAYYAGLMSLLALDGGMVDFSAGRPIDATALDWGRMAETGVGVHVDPFMAFLRADEACGLYLFYHDQLARLAAYNLQIHTAGMSIESFDDEGETYYFEGDTPYPWEALGAPSPAYLLKHVQHEAKDVQFRDPVSAIEPNEPRDQFRIYRYQEWGGYLGQGRIRQVVVPRFLAGAIPTYRGVFREQISLDGSYAIASSKSLVIAKRPFLPTPQRQFLAHESDGSGDNTENYNAAGLWGVDPSPIETSVESPHKVGNIETPDDSEVPNLLSAAGVRDLHAYVYNHKGIHAFLYHRDFQTPDGGLSSTQNDPQDFSDLSESQFLTPPIADRVYVDHRYKEVKFYPSTSHLTMLEDGGVVIGDGYGSELRMTGGSIFISCPGDLFLQPGRNIVQMAGRDLILRAKNSMDLTTTDKDIRLKAEKNLHMLAGNSHSGGVLIESRASGTVQDYDGKVGEEVVSSGIVLKAPNSSVVGWGAEIYLRTGSTEGGVSGGPIVLDADKGQQPIRTVSSSFTRYLDGQAKDVFGILQPRGVNLFTATRATLAGGLQANGGVIITEGGLQISGNVAVANGHIGTSLARSYRNLVGNLEGTSLAGVQLNIDTASAESQGQASSALNEFRSNIEQRFYAEGRIGHGELQRAVTFSLRDMAQYRTEQFIIPEAAWQQQQSAGAGGTAWKETIVEAANQQLMPYPGYERWSVEAALMQFAHTLHDLETGVDKGTSDEAYDDPHYGEPEFAVLNDAYLIIS